MRRYNPTSTANKQDREYKKQQDEVFCKVFRSMQLCWWYALYAPEYGDWGSEQAKAFTLKMDEVNDRVEALGREGKEALMQQFITESGINFIEIANSIPYQVKANMYGKTPPTQNYGLKIAFPFQMNNAAREGMFLPTYTLYTEYKTGKEEIERYIEYFKEFSKEYKAGLKDRHIIKYFQEVEEIQVLL